MWNPSNLEGSRSRRFVKVLLLGSKGMSLPFSSEVTSSKPGLLAFAGLAFLKLALSGR